MQIELGSKWVYTVTGKTVTVRELIERLYDGERFDQVGWTEDGGFPYETWQTSRNRFEIEFKPIEETCTQQSERSKSEPSESDVWDQAQAEVTAHLNPRPQQVVANLLRRPRG